MTVKEDAPVMDVEVEQPHHHPHHKTGHDWLDKAVPLSALLISVVSIGIAVHHGKVMESLVHQNERLVQANSLPYVELGQSSGTSLDGPLRPSLIAMNNGVGPAQIRSVSVTVDGRAMKSVDALMDACCGGRENGAHMATSTLLNRMLKAGELSQYVIAMGTTAQTPAGKAFVDASNSGRIVTTICYCSVFEECWVNSSHGMVRPKRVENCPMPTVQYES